MQRRRDEHDRPAREPAVYEVTAADFLATVEHTARVLECTPEACGYPRVRRRHPEDAASARRLVHETVTVDWVAELPAEAKLLPASWVPGGTCGLACPELMRTPDALLAVF